MIISKYIFKGLGLVRPYNIFERCLFYSPRLHLFENSCFIFLWKTYNDLFYHNIIFYCWINRIAKTHK